MLSRLLMSATFIYVTEELLQRSGKGVKQDVTKAIREKYLVDKCRTSIWLR